MMNPTDLDVRVLNHAARAEYADRFGSLYPAQRATHSGARQRVAALLLRLSVRLAPAPTQQATARDTVTAA